MSIRICLTLDNQSCKNLKSTWYVENLTFVLNSKGMVVNHYQSDINIVHFKNATQNLSVVTDANNYLLMFSRDLLTSSKYRSEFAEYVVDNIIPNSTC